MQLHFYDTDSQDVFEGSRQYLSDLARDGELTEETLHQSMTAFYNSGHRESIGFAWMIERPDLFAETAKRCGFSVEDFLLGHGRLHWVGNRLLLVEKLLMLVPEDRREAFVRTCYFEFSAFNDDWIPIAIRCGVPEASVADMLFQGLLIESRQCVTGNCHRIESFLRSGYREKQYWGHTPWSVLSETQFQSALAMGATKAPKQFFNNRGSIEAALGKELFTELGRQAALRIEVISRQWQKFVEEQDLDFQLQVARMPKQGADFLIGLILRLDPRKGSALYWELRDTLDADIAYIYRTTWQLRHQNGKPRAQSLERNLERQLRENGWILGELQTSHSTPATIAYQGMCDHVLEFWHNRHRYIVDKDQKGYEPKAGDKVLTHPGRLVKVLSPEVFAATMLPAQTAEHVHS